MADTGKWNPNDPLDPNRPQGAGYQQFPDPSIGPGDPRADASSWQNWEQWTELWDAMQKGQDPRGALTNIMEGFRGGNQRDLGYFLEHPAWKHMMAFSLKDSPQWKQMAGMQFPKEQLLASGMGQIGAAGRQAVQQGMAGLQQSGLGRSPGAVAAIQRAGNVAAGQAGANLQATVGERAYNAELARLGNLLSLEQAMQQIALGISPDRTNPNGSNKPGGGDWLALLGSLAGAGATVAAACWVARAVYGEENPRWMLFRTWLRTRSSPRFYRLYMRHGPWVAKLVKALPFLKSPIRAWMDRRIESLRRPDEMLCAKT